MKKSLKTHLITFTITTFVFFLGIFLGMNFETSKTSYVETHYEELKRMVSNSELEFYFIQIMQANMPCDYFIEESYKLTKESDALAIKLSDYENSRGFSDPNWLGLKHDYTLSLVKNWIFVEKIRGECNANYTTIIYFYDTECAGACEDLSFYLSYYKKKDKRLMVYALQSDLDLQIMNLLKGAFNITKIPSLVVNGDEKFVNLSSREEVKTAVCSSNGMNFC